MKPVLVGFNKLATWTRLTHRKESQPENLQLCWIEMCDGSMHEFTWIFDSHEKRFYDNDCSSFFEIDEVSRWLPVNLPSIDNGELK